MTSDDQIRDEKLQYDINREAAKISALSSNKIDKYEYLTGEEILPSSQKKIQHKLNLPILLQEKLLKKTKATEDQDKKLVEALKTKASNCKSDDNPSISKEI